MTPTDLSALVKQSDRMKQILGIENEPIGVLLLGAEDERDVSAYKDISGYRYCQMLMCAQRGESVLLNQDGLACPAAAAAFGFRKYPAKLASGKGLVSFGIVERPETGAKLFNTMPGIPSGQIAAIAAAPMNDVDTLPDVVVVKGRPEQLMWLLLADLNVSGGTRRQANTAVIQATCVDCTVIPYIEQRLNFSLGCYECREATDIDSTETMLGFPGVLLNPLAEALEFLSAQAIPRSRTKKAYEHFIKNTGTSPNGPSAPAGPIVHPGILPRLERDMVISLSPVDVMGVFRVTLDSDRDAALDLVVNVLYKKIRKILERPHCMPVFEMNQKVSDKG